MSEAQPPPQPPGRSSSQSLFQIYYLGCTKVDRRCSSVVMPWIIEEQKLKSQEMKFIWLTPGPDDVCYVADSGQELFNHSYTSILQCCIAVDGISFAYVCRSVEDNVYYCHVFQALTYAEANNIMAKFKVHAREEVSIGSTISTNSNTSPTDPPLKSSGLIFSSSLKHHPPDIENSKNPEEKHKKVACEYSVEFLGKFEVPPPSSSNDTQFQTIDKIVAKLRESQSKKVKKRTIGSLFRDRMSSSSSLKSHSHTSLGSEDVDFTSTTTKVTNGTLCEDASTSLSSTSNASLHSQDSSDVAIRVTSSSPDPISPSGGVQFSVTSDKEDSSEEQTRSPSKKRRLFKRVVSTSSSPSKERQANSIGVTEVGSTSPKSSNKAQIRNGDLKMKQKTSNKSSSGNISNILEHQPSSNNEVSEPSEDKSVQEETKRSDSMEFDTIPELPSLQDTLEFKALSEGSPLLLPSEKVKLIFSGLSVMLVSEKSGERIMKKSIRYVACCAQGQVEPNYIAFTSSSREGDAKKYHCHLFLAENKKVAIRILESFKSSFVHALSFGMPAALCDSCPIQQLHNLCRSLEGVSTQVGQSRIQECLGTINEGDYAKIMHDYKVSEHADHEYTQIVVLVGLIRRYFMRQQELHTHPGTGMIVSSSSSSSLETSSSRLRLPALTRAKNALATSIDNLRNKPSDRGSRFFKSLRTSASVDKPVGKIVEDERVTQSLNAKTLSPIFSRKTSLDTLMAPIPTTPVKHKTEEDTRRERTWSGFIHKRSPRPSMLEDTDGKQKPLLEQEGKDETRSPSPDGHRQIDQPVASEKHATFKLQDFNDEQTSPTSKTLLTPVRKINSNRPRDRLKFQRNSLTPPARLSTSSPMETEPKFRRTHRRSTSYAHTASSWRQEIFESVNTPTKPDGSRRAKTVEFFEDFEIIDPPTIDQLGRSWNIGRGSFVRGQQDSQVSPRTKTRKMWKDAIEQQIILNRMEKQNSLFQKASTDAELKRIKLCYSNPDIDSRESILQWSEVLTQAGEIPYEELHKKVLKGISPSKRGEVWSMLAKQYQARNEIDRSLPPGLTDQDGFRQLLEEETEFENNILVDIGRTFPNHPYFSGNRDGQSSLRNVLHAYAVADTETGYCQGLSFVAGMIQMHTKDDESAYEVLYQLMTLYNYREMYFDNLTYLQMRLYQLSRLLHDFNPVLYQHLQTKEITPFFYAAPWFLTIFASQFPIAFTARVFDMIFCEGADFVLKVVLSLLQIHEDSIVECGSMESTCNYLKTNIPEESLQNVDTILETASRIDFGNRLETFESEYHVMAELNFCFKSDLVIDDFTSVADVLKKQNVALIEQLAICHTHNSRLEGILEFMQVQMETQNQRIIELESKVSLLSTQSSPANQSLSPSDNQDPDKTLVATDETL